MLSKILLTSLFITVHSFYSSTCCSDRDCHPVACEDIIELSTGSYQYQGLEFYKSRIYPSEDNQCHACIVEPNEVTKERIPYCLYIQQNT